MLLLLLESLTHSLTTVRHWSPPTNIKKSAPYWQLPIHTDTHRVGFPQIPQGKYPTVEH